MIAMMMIMKYTTAEDINYDRDIPVSEIDALLAKSTMQHIENQEVRQDDNDNENNSNDNNNNNDDNDDDDDDNR